MTRDDILRWARESRLYGVDVDGLDRFANLVAAHEREECAKVWEAGLEREGWKLVPVHPTEEMLAATSWPGCAATDYAHMIAAAPAPPLREWQSLTDEERTAIYSAWMDNESTDSFDLMDSVEAALKAKNGGGE